MGYRITVDNGNCLNCGVCMDVCPVQALDMSRPAGGGVETGGSGRALPWMMEYPAQVGECIGCTSCIRECPVNVMTLDTVAGPTPLLARQGPMGLPGADGAGWSEIDGGGWIPLSAATRDVLKPRRGSPFEPFMSWAVRDVPATRTDPGHRPDWGYEPARLEAPCQTACPAGTDAARYVGLIAEGRYDDAYAVAAEVNPFPSVCGWICSAPCEPACRRGTLDEPISIRTLKRFAAEHGTLPKIAPPKTRRTEKVAIVGGGPAGMSAAYYLARLGYKPTVFEAMPLPGGMMALGIPSYRLPREVLQAEIQRILDLGVDLKLDHAMGRDFTLSDLERDGFAAVFLSTGAPKSRRLGVEGDDLRGVVPATVFLKRVNLGENPKLSGDVVVVGGGSTAMDAARSAWRSGASSVTVLYRRGRDDMRAQREEVEDAEREGVAFKFGAVIADVQGRDGAVSALNMTTQTKGPDGQWTTVAGSEATLPVNTILVAIGEEPDPSILPEGAGIEVSSWAGIVADSRTLATGKAGVFAGGDVVSGPKTVIDAVASGRRAAGAIHEYLGGVADGEAVIMAAVRYPTATPSTLTLDIAVAPRVRPALPMVDPSFTASHPGFDEAQARAEASRCFRCDAVVACATVTVSAGRNPAHAPVAAAAAHPTHPAPAAPPMAATTGGQA